MQLRKTPLALVAMATCSLVAVAPSASALTSGHTTAAPKHWSRILTTDVLAPFSLAVQDGHVWVADGGTSTVSKIVGGHLKTVASGPQPGEVAGLDIGSHGTYAYSSLNYATGASQLTIKSPGKPDVVADLSTYEATRNPDKNQTYGVPAYTNACAKAFFEAVSGGPATYKGQVDSHPYAVASLGNGRWAVGDAGGNDILKVDSKGNISTLAVLPPQKTTITAAMAAALGAPACVVGVTYAFEPVPTDVEVGPNGGLFVSTLPGGPEDSSLGARGSVYRVNAQTGGASRLATGFLGATNLAVGADGAVFVTELFGGKVSRVQNGHTSTFATLDAPLSVEVENGWVYVGTLAPTDDTGTPIGKGSVVKYRRLG